MSAASLGSNNIEGRVNGRLRGSESALAKDLRVSNCEAKEVAIVRADTDMEQPKHKLLLILTLLFSTVTVESEYLRPLPRKTLTIPLYSISKAHSSYPQQVHISLAGEKHIRVTWITDDKHSPSYVEYGTLPGRYDSIAEGEFTSYNYMLYTSGTIHHVVIGPLEDNTVYFYRCGGKGPDFQLKTPPNQFPIVFAVAGDLGQTGWTKSTLAHIDQSQYDVYLLPGDLSYADCMQHLWDSFGELVEPLASTRPWMVTEGNHEEENILLLTDNFVSYNSRWKMPFEESGSTSNLYYSFEVAGVHVIMLGSYEDYDVYSEQYRWLKEDLSKVDRERTPWLLVSFHIPWYNSNKAHQGAGDDMMAAIEPLLYAASVDLVIAGHVHAYERSAIFRYINPQPKWSEFREASFGHGELKFVNSTHALWSWHRNDDDNSVKVDDIWINSLVSSGCVDQKTHELRSTLMIP
ncbi:Purple acid phosphatase [Vigna angularis]|uniref:Purple acid phosphatase n=1 Tax=Phaseolus angularis TaxID=3914 RepID=A0A8T0K1B5_PHAAN|nr:Purple acid phosphatase [Vigna angularis]